MPKLIYRGPEGTHYPSLPVGDGLGLVPVPGETYDLGLDPGDGNWEKPAKADAK